MNNNGLKKRWISLYVENEVGVLSKISGLFSGKSYNLDSLTVGTTEDPTVSRMTIATVSDDETFEQIKKQLNRCVEIIKVIDITDAPTHMKELLFIHIHDCSEEEKAEIISTPIHFYRKEEDKLVFAIQLNKQMNELAVGNNVYEDALGIIHRNPSLTPAPGFQRVDAIWLSTVLR
jgi:acetolactate synthase-1/3 small subunit